MTNNPHHGRHTKKLSPTVPPTPIGNGAHGDIWQIRQTISEAQDNLLVKLVTLQPPCSLLASLRRRSGAVALVLSRLLSIPSETC